MAPSACRLCGQLLSETFVDLGLSPLANAYVTPARLSQKEIFYPLHVFVCGSCLLVQLDEFESPEHIFSDYLYFSSFSDLWLAHCRTYADHMVERFGLGAKSQVVEVASNDGYLLQYFLPHGVPVLGVEPAANVAQTAIAKGIPTEVAFFGTETAQRLRARGVEADLIAGNNVLAHVPRLLDFVQGLQILLKPEGVVTIEVPHLLRLVAENQFDTIYHEHFSYFSLLVLDALFARVHMRIVDVEELWTHGGSLRVYVRHAAAAGSPTEAVGDVLARERAAGLERARRLSTLCAAGRADEMRRARVLRRGCATRSDGRRVRRTGEGQHAPELLRRRPGADALHGRPQPAQTGPLPAWHTHTGPSTGSVARVQARLRVHPAVEPARRNHTADVRGPRVGRTVRRPDPRAQGVLMRFTPSELPGTVIVDVEGHVDTRGLFARTFCEEEFAAARLPTRFVQSSVSFNTRRGTLRGLHYQALPKPEGKVVRCTRGAIHDVVVDLRPSSATFLRWIGVELTAENRRALYVPPGCAHGFQTLVDDSEVLYLMTEFYAPEMARGVRWNDPMFGVEWPIADPTISERDATYPDFRP